MTAVLRSARQWMGTKTAAWALIVFALALVLRLVTTMGIGAWDYMPTSDDRLYLNIARSLAHSGRYATSPGSSLTANRSPLFPLLLAGVFRFLGEQRPIAQVVLMVFSSATASLTLLLGKRAIGLTVGVLAGLWVAFDPFAWVFGGLFWSEPLYSFLFVSSTLVLLRELRAPGRYGSLLVGSLLGLTGLSRPNGLIVAAWSAVLLLLEGTGRWKQRIWQCVSVLAVVALFLTPWVVRNYLTFDRLILTSLDSGRVLVGVYNETCLKYRCLDWLLPEWLPELEPYGWADLNEIERNALGTELAITNLRAHPLEYLNLMPGKLGHFWSQDTYVPVSQPPLDRPAALMLYQRIYYWVLFASGILGMFALYFAGHRRVFVLLASFIAIFSLTTLLLWGNARFRLPLHPLLSVSSAFLFVVAYGRIQSLRSRRGVDDEVPDTPSPEPHAS